jgi:hypothetical protein
MPSLDDMAAQNADANCTPLSEVSAAGTLYLATQPAMNTSAQSAAAVALNGRASAHLVDWPTTMRRCVKPSFVAGRGPTRSRCTWEKLGSGDLYGLHRRRRLLYFLSYLKKLFIDFIHYICDAHYI